MNKIVFIIVTIFAINTLGIQNVLALDGTLDARCTTVDQYGFKNVGLKAPDEQTFTPSFDRFTQADFIWGGQLTGLHGINISLINSIGTVVGSGTVTPTINGGPVTRSWVPSSPISVRKGVTYKLRVENPANADLVWYAGMNTCYSGGNARQANADENFDFGFSTYGYDSATPTPGPTATPAPESTVAPTQSAQPSSSQSSTSSTSSNLSNTSLNAGSSAGTGAAPSSNISSSIAEPTELKIFQTTVEGKAILTMNWTASKTSNINGYKIFKSDNEQTGFKNIGNVDKNVLEFKDAEIEVGKTYYYQVRAYKATLESKSSNTASKQVEETPAVSTFDSTNELITPAIEQKANRSISGWFIIALALVLMLLTILAYKYNKWPFIKKNIV